MFSLFFNDITKLAEALFNPAPAFPAEEELLSKLPEFAKLGG